MLRKNYLIDFLTFSSILFMLITLIVMPTTISSGIYIGISVCAKIIIPSIFPFSVLCIFCIESGIIEKYVKTPFAFSVFIFVLSLLGGYPVGANLISTAYENGKISKNDSEKLLFVCINAGPAFVITAIGGVVFNSTRLGVYLFLSHVLASSTLFLLNAKRFCEIKLENKLSQKTQLSKAFVLAVGKSSGALINICSYVILFSGITNLFSNKYLVCFLEITNASINTKNIYLISFLLGFSGVCIIMQIISISNEFLTKRVTLVTYRILHGILSVFFLKALFFLFPVKIETFSNLNNFGYKTAYGNSLGGIILIVMMVLFIYMIDNKKYSGKIIKDIW